MIFLIFFAIFFVIGFMRAVRAGGALADRLRYGFVHGLAALLISFMLFTLLQFTGVI